MQKLNLNNLIKKSDNGSQDQKNLQKYDQIISNCAFVHDYQSFKNMNLQTSESVKKNNIVFSSIEDQIKEDIRAGSQSPLQQNSPLKQEKQKPKNTKTCLPFKFFK